MRRRGALIRAVAIGWVLLACSLGQAENQAGLFGVSQSLYLPLITK